jgi:hypothetical protein
MAVVQELQGKLMPRKEDLWEQALLVQVPEAD